MKILKPAVPGMFLFCLLFIAGCLERPGSGRIKEIDADTDTISSHFGKCTADTLCKGNQNKRTTSTKTAANNTTCLAITRKKTRCKRSPRAGGYCWQHAR